MSVQEKQQRAHPGASDTMVLPCLHLFLPVFLPSHLFNLIYHTSKTIADILLKFTNVNDLYFALNLFIR